MIVNVWMKFEFPNGRWRRLKKMSPHFWKSVYLPEQIYPLTTMYMYEVYMRAYFYSSIPILTSAWIPLISLAQITNDEWYSDNF